MIDWERICKLFIEYHTDIDPKLTVKLLDKWLDEEDASELLQEVWNGEDNPYKQIKEGKW